MVKHASGSFTRRAVATAVLGAAVAVPVALAADASADSVNWTAIANCESSGDWAANTGNGFYGGLQFTESTWLAYGGGQYAQYAYQASESQQIAVAEKVLAGQGIGAWPVCGAHAGDGTTYAGTDTGGASSGGSGSSADSGSGSSSDHSGASKQSSSGSSAHHSAHGGYTVRSGDTLSGIAAEEGIADWHALYTANASTIGPNPNLIFPGQVLDLG